MTQIDSIGHGPQRGRRDPIEGVATHVFFRDNSPRVLMAWISAWFDASGTQSEGPLVVAAGVVSTKVRWKAFDRRFMALLRSEGISHLHTSDFFKRKKPFSGWTQHRQDAFLGAILEMTTEWIDRVFVRTVRVDLYRSFDREFKVHEELGGAYSVAQLGVLKDTLDWVYQHRENPKRDSFHAVIEQGDAGQPAFMQVVKRHWDYQPTLLPKFDPRGEAYTPFCLADLVAYVHRNHYLTALEKRVSPWKIPWPPSLIQMRKAFVVDSAFVDRASFKAFCETLQIAKRS